MTGLRRLRIRVDYSQVFWYGVVDHTFWNRAAADLLGGVKHITAPRTFIVSIPNPQCARGVDIGNSRCVFEIRGDGDGSQDAVEVP
jgi:hypothetical protein